jgi:hypothetical protein
MIRFPISLIFFKKANSNRKVSIALLMCLMGLLSSCIPPHFLTSPNVPNDQQNTNLEMVFPPYKPVHKPEDLKAHINLLKDAHSKIEALKKTVEKNQPVMKLDIEINPSTVKGWNPNALKALEDNIKKNLEYLRELTKKGNLHETNQEKKIKLLQDELKTIVDRLPSEQTIKSCLNCNENFQKTIERLNSLADQLIKTIQYLEKQTPSKEDTEDKEPEVPEVPEEPEVWKISLLALIVALSAYMANIRSNIIQLIKERSSPYKGFIKTTMHKKNRFMTS